MLGATLVKHHGHQKVFETVFDVYFSLFSPASTATTTAEGAEGAGEDVDMAGEGQMDVGGGAGRRCRARSSRRCCSTRS